MAATSGSEHLRESKVICSLSPKEKEKEKKKKKKKEEVWEADVSMQMEGDEALPIRAALPSLIKD
ncbi:hypothetical protein C0995_012905, partial [Termitomyces sp. Mi166